MVKNKAKQNNKNNENNQINNSKKHFSKEKQQVRRNVQCGKTLFW